MFHDHGKNVLVLIALQILHLVLSPKTVLLVTLPSPKVVHQLVYVGWVLPLKRSHTSSAACTPNESLLVQCPDDYQDSLHSIYWKAPLVSMWRTRHPKEVSRLCCCFRLGLTRVCSLISGPFFTKGLGIALKHRGMGGISPSLPHDVNPSNRFLCTT